jgi:hypothetical protein
MITEIIETKRDVGDLAKLRNLLERWSLDNLHQIGDEFVSVVNIDGDAVIVSLEEDTLSDGTKLIYIRIV